MTTKTQTGHTIIARQSLAAGATIRGTLDVSGANIHGGHVTLRITTGGTGPNPEATIRVMTAHRGASMPAAGPEGTGPLDWKELFRFGSSIAANIPQRRRFTFGPEVAYIQIEAVGGGLQPVDVEAHGTTFGV
jgi:hypothetical protein